MYQVIFLSAVTGEDREAGGRQASPQAFNFVKLIIFFFNFMATCSSRNIFINAGDDSPEESERQQLPGCSARALGAPWERQTVCSSDRVIYLLHLFITKERCECVLFGLRHHCPLISQVVGFFSDHSRIFTLDPSASRIYLVLGFGGFFCSQP